MVKTLFAPAFWLLGRLNFMAGFLLACILFLLPTLVALFAHDALPRSELYAVVATLSLLAIYTLIALRALVAGGTERIIRITDRIAGGELMADGLRIDGAAGSRDAGRLWGSILQMNASLTEIVKQVRASAETIAGASRSISEGNTQLAQRTQEQAASLEETASGVEQLAASARQNADSCARASTLAGDSREIAAEASRRMQELAATMHGIDASARRVGDILGTVEGIAFQTNILALNAAVEAARAGDQGRGFAVVASEVRTLAQRSAAAAREIQALIGESIANADKGRKLVDATEGTMSQVVASVEQVGEVLGAIALATREQSAGVHEISQAIAQVDAVTQQNATLVEEAASAAESFDEEARRLVDVVGRFKTDRSDERGRVVALVKAGVEHARTHGAQRACADFCDRGGRFVRGEDYLFALDFSGTRLAYAPDPSTVGRNDMDNRDADGKAFTRDLIELARAQGFGWYDYRMLNPRTGVSQPKSVYFERVGDIVIGCGIYRADAATPTQQPLHRPLAPQRRLAA